MFEPKRPRVMILGMKLHLVNLCKFCTQNASGIITGPAQGLEARSYRPNFAGAFLER